MAHSKRGRYRGHCWLCAMRTAKFRGKRRDRNDANTRRMMGRTRRIGRHDIPADQTS